MRVVTGLAAGATAAVVLVGSSTTSARASTGCGEVVGDWRGVSTAGSYVGRFDDGEAVAVTVGPSGARISTASGRGSVTPDPAFAEAAWTWSPADGHAATLDAPVCSGGARVTGATFHLDGRSGALLRTG